ncbi:MAG: polyprenol monophosphomannose synthase, partial [Pirellulaceae bacterium]|nr:polyprenol monophosphomannose synthase [Pirellulaceae bacterium]
DDNSPDGTGRWCDERAAAETRLRCLHRPGKLGLGTAMVAAMRYGIEHDYRYLLNMDADFSHHPRYLPDLIAGMDPGAGPTIDVMIGSRYVRGGGVEGWPLHRRLMSRAVNLFARVLLGIRARDCSGSFRCYRVATLAKVDLGAIRSRGYSFYEEILYRLGRVGARMSELPITFADRRHGASKINPTEAIRAMGVLLQLGMQRLFGR